MESLLRQLRLLQGTVALLLIATTALCLKLRYPFLTRRVKVLEAQTINIRESDGTLKAVLSNATGFTAMSGDRASQPGGVPFSGLLFYNQEGRRCQPHLRPIPSGSECLPPPRRA